MRARCGRRGTQGREAFGEGVLRAHRGGSGASSRVAPVVLYRAIGDKLPARLAEGAVLWALCQLAAQRTPDSIRRAGFAGEGVALGDALFDGILASPSGVVFSVDDWEESWKRIGTPDGRIQLAIPELFEELDSLATEPTATADREYPVRALGGRASLLHGQHDRAQSRLAPEGCGRRPAHQPRRRRSAWASRTAGACASRPGAAAPR